MFNFNFIEILKKFKRFCNVLTLLGILISLSPPAFAATERITKEKALEFVKFHFSNRVCDYYLCKTLSNYNPPAPLSNTRGEWVIFVDPEPGKGWKHTAYISRVPKVCSTTGFIPALESVQMPPDDILIPLDVTNKYGSNATLKPKVERNSNLNENNALSNHYAIILSGGYNASSNYDRYWNDCSFIYQTLVNKYGVPKSNIVPLLSDGNDPAADMFVLSTNKYVSQPLDLDFDGVYEIELAATKTNLTNTISDFGNKINKGEHLFIFVIDHGGTLDYDSQSYICLWNQQVIHDYELAQLLAPLCEKGIIVNAVLGQCFSGGFIDDLEKAGCVVATASSGSESSWSCPNIPYDEFVYKWTSALNEMDAHGNRIESDLDGNGQISMLEAFEYAKKYDIVPETPQYSSNPLHLGKELSFNNIPQPVDLYIRDDIYDTGEEPYNIECFWNSPDIWIRNLDDGIEEHENPYYSITHPSAVINVRVHNRGWMSNDKTVKNWMHTYWAKASTGLTKAAWKGRELYNDEMITGEHLRAVSVGDLAPGESKVVKVAWALPIDAMDSMPDDIEEHHFCLLARILSTSTDDKYEPPLPGETMHYDVTSDRKAAQKNVSIITGASLTRGTKVFIRNVYNSGRQYSLEIRPHTQLDEQIFTRAKVGIEMSNTILGAWALGGNSFTDVEYNPTLSRNIVIMRSSKSRLSSIIMDESEFDYVTMRFNFKEPSINNEKYTFDLIQRDENGQIVGGETFIVYSPTELDWPLELLSEEKNGQTELYSNLSGGDYSFMWLDANDNIIGTDDTLSIPTERTTNDFDKISVIATSTEGKIAKSSISLSKGNKITNINVNISRLETILENPMSKAGGKIQLSSVLDPTTPLVSKNIEIGESVININISTLPKGIYSINYIFNGIIIDSKKVSI